MKPIPTLLALIALLLIACIGLYWQGNTYRQTALDCEGNLKVLELEAHAYRNRLDDQDASLQRCSKENQDLRASVWQRDSLLELHHIFNPFLPKQAQ